MAVFSNQASLDYNGSVIPSNVVTGELREAPTLTKSAAARTYTIGGTVTYTIAFTNVSTVNYTNLALTDDLGAYTLGDLTLIPLDYVPGSTRYSINGVEQPVPLVDYYRALRVNGLSLPANSTATLTYQATANGYAPPMGTGTITNVAELSGDELRSEVRSSETIGAAPSTRLGLVKTLDPAAVAEGDRLRYTFTIQNEGNTAAADAGLLTDRFDPYLSDLTVTFNGDAWQENTDYTYATDGLFATLPGKLSVAAATYTQDAATGLWQATPGTATLVAEGTVAPITQTETTNSNTAATPAGPDTTR